MIGYEAEKIDDIVVDTDDDTVVKAPLANHIVVVLGGHLIRDSTSAEMWFKDSDETALTGPLINSEVKGFQWAPVLYPARLKTAVGKGLSVHVGSGGRVTGVLNVAYVRHPIRSVA